MSPEAAAEQVSARQEDTLSPLEVEVIELFVRLVSVLKLPRSIGEIYGLLYLSRAPLNMEDLTQRLQLSKGSASQGLALLRSFGAVRTVYVPGDRRNHYEAEVELRKLAAGFIKEQVQPHLFSGQERLGAIRALQAEMPEAAQAQVEEPIRRLESWHKRGSNLLPLARKIIGGWRNDD